MGQPLYWCCRWHSILMVPFTLYFDGAIDVIFWWCHWRANIQYSVLVNSVWSKNCSFIPSMWLPLRIPKFSSYQPLLVSRYNALFQRTCYWIQDLSNYPTITYTPTVIVRRTTWHKPSRKSVFAPSIFFFTPNEDVTSVFNRPTITRYHSSLFWAV